MGVAVGTADKAALGSGLANPAVGQALATAPVSGLVSTVLNATAVPDYCGLLLGLPTVPVPGDFTQLPASVMSQALGALPPPTWRRAQLAACGRAVPDAGRAVADPTVVGLHDALARRGRQRAKRAPGEFPRHRAHRASRVHGGRPASRPADRRPDQVLTTLPNAATGTVLSELPAAGLTQVLTALPSSALGNVFTGLPTSDLSEVLTALPSSSLGSVLTALPPPSSVSVLTQLPAGT